MARKLALLIGVSEYGEGFDPLSAPPQDVAALRRVLENPELGGFDQVTTCLNPDLIKMRMEIEGLFARSTREDLVLLFFSGHGITDDNFRLYLTTRLSAKDSFRSTSVDARFIQDLSDGPYARRQVIILDCCYSGAFAEGWRRKGDVKVELERELGKEGRVVLTSSSSTQVSFQQEDAELSLYTQYLVEGIETGAADTDRDGAVRIRELHDYAKRKVQEVKPKLKPDIIVADDEGYEILLSQVKRDAAASFRQLVEECVDHERGDILDIDLETLQVRAQRLGVSSDQARAIINSVLEPFRRRQKNLERYREKYAQYVEREYPLSPRLLERLHVWQEEVLGLGDREVVPIQRAITQEKDRRIAEAREIANQVEHYPSPKDIPTPKGISTPRNVPTPERIAPFSPKSAATPTTQTILNPPSAPSRQTPSPRTPTSTPHSRRQVLKWAGLGGGGLLIAILGGRLIEESSSPDITPAPPPELKTEQVKTARVNEQGEVTEEASVDISVYDEDLGNSITLGMVQIPGGEFLMGQTEAEKQELIRQVGEENYQSWYARELPRHQVNVSSFFMGKFPVTQAQYEAVMGENPATQYDRDRFVDPNKPVVGVSWNEAIAFCERLSQQTGREYRLPSEAEWEYACRAGTETPFYFGETITTDLANYRGTDWEYQGTTYPGNYGNGPKGIFREQATPVGSFPANAFGLFDMHGNVWEWCLDHWHENYEGAPTDGSAWIEGGDSTRRLLRGGSWDNVPRYCRSAYRDRDVADGRYSYIGFRVVSSSPRTL
ncbi:MAG: SUMF1/EgtB/PvdO family nonheme iron enzyme [Synechococcales bacterium]|nr:SUMF1/EgtB/PvdO family nonheme iron enzyme [Synechococcales bacterium]